MAGPVGPWQGFHDFQFLTPIQKVFFDPSPTSVSIKSRNAWVKLFDPSIGPLFEHTLHEGPRCGWFACLFKLGAAAVFRYVLVSFLVARGMVFTRCPKMVLFDFLCTLPKGVGVKIRSPIWMDEFSTSDFGKGSLEFPLSEMFFNQDWIQST